MTSKDIARLRLMSQNIASGNYPNAASAAVGLCAMQAQDYQSLLWSIGARVEGATKETAESALAEKSIVRTWLFRGTLQLVAKDDLRWMLALVAPRLVSGSRRRRENLGLDDAAFALSRKTLVSALGGGRTLDRDALQAKFEEAGLSTAGGRGYHLIWRAALDGVLCQGAPNGTEQDFVLLDEWVPQGTRLEGEEAFAELALRYFSGHGPATVQDFIGWTGLTARDARTGLAAVADKLERVVAEDKEYWMKPGAPVQNSGGAEGVFLLPGFDEFMLGYKDRDAALESAFAERICPGNNGVFLPTVVSAGQVVGTWRRALKKGTVVVTATPFVEFGSEVRDGISSAAERYASFLGFGLRLEGI